MIGLGVGEALAEALAAHPGVRVAALCDRDPAVLARVAAKHPGARLERDDEAVAGAADLDLVVVATWEDSHARLAVRAIESGKHVFVEKPLCQRRDEALAIRQALRAHPRCRLGSNLILRRSPRFLRLRTLIDDGTIGTPYYLEGDYNYGRIHKVTHGWRGTLPFYSIVGGGGVHLIDLMMWLTRDRVVEVEAWGNKIVSRDTAFRFDDLVVLLLRFASGAIGKVAVNFGCVTPHFHPVTVYGTRATFVNGRDHAVLYTSRDPAVPPSLVTDPYPGVHKGALLQDFVGGLSGAEPPGIPEEDIFAAMAVVLAADKALESGSRQPVETL